MDRRFKDTFADFFFELPLNITFYRQLNILRSLHNPARFITLKLLDKNPYRSLPQVSKRHSDIRCQSEYHDQVNNSPLRSEW